ncbi:MAG: hypothetical protein PWP04_134 [Candidatus Atribacteria bacterium]|nr:hypothetical protein [Candidatus Atribacteria bacterium]
MNNVSVYDIAFIGHYTKDIIISPSGKRIVDGGAFNYGSHVAIRMGLRVATITSLAPGDSRVIDKLEDLGVEVFLIPSKRSTCLTIEYPTNNVDERILLITSFAEPFSPSDVKDISAKAFVIGTSVRDEVSPKVIEEIRKKDTFISADVQGFMRVNRGGRLVYEKWPEKEYILAHIDVLKADAIEAEALTGEKDIKIAAKKLSALGPDEILITHKNGVLLYVNNNYYEAKFYPEKLVGRSGRGDTCIAAYMAQRLTVSPPEALLWAAAVTSLKMENEGPFQKSLSEVEELLKNKYYPTDRLKEET